MRGQSSRFSLAVTGAAGAGIALSGLLRLRAAGSRLSAAAAAPPAWSPGAGSCRVLKIWARWTGLAVDAGRRGGSWVPT